MSFVLGVTRSFRPPVAQELLDVKYTLTFDEWLTCFGNIDLSRVTRGVCGR